MVGLSDAQVERYSDFILTVLPFLIPVLSHVRGANPHYASDVVKRTFLPHPSFHML